MAALRESRRNLLGLEAAQKALEEAIKREKMQACAHRFLATPWCREQGIAQHWHACLLAVTGCKTCSPS